MSVLDNVVDNVLDNVADLAAPVGDGPVLGNPVNVTVEPVNVFVTFPGNGRNSLAVVDLNAKGSPSLHVNLPPEGSAASLVVTLNRPEGVSAGDLKANTFTATALTGCPCPKDRVDLTVTRVFDDSADAMVITIAFPVDGIGSRGTFSLVWLRPEMNTLYPVVGTYVRDLGL